MHGRTHPARDAGGRSHADPALPAPNTAPDLAHEAQLSPLALRNFAATTAADCLSMLTAAFIC
jgi:hypothetical protein